jgi:hypothetical protein
MEIEIQTKTEVEETLMIKLNEETNNVKMCILELIKF